MPETTPEHAGGATLLDTVLGLVQQLGERLHVVEVKLADHDPRLTALETAVQRIDLHLSEQDTASAAHNAAVLERMDTLEAGRVADQTAIARIDDSFAVLSTTTKSDAGHRRETNRKVIETVDELKADVLTLKTAYEEQERTRAAQATEAQRRAEARHVQLLAEQKRMADLVGSFNGAVTRYGSPVAVALTVFLITSGSNMAQPWRTLAYGALGVGIGGYVLYWTIHYLITQARLRRLRGGKP